VATFNFASLTNNFLVSTVPVHVGGGILQESGTLAWDNSGDAFFEVELNGTNLQYTSGVPVSGTATSGQVFLSSNTSVAADLVMTELTTQIADLAAFFEAPALGTSQQANLFWHSLLSGDDTILFGNSSRDIEFYGDGLDLTDGSVTGGDDTMTGIVNRGEAFYAASGDFRVVSAGATLLGGLDVMQLSISTFASVSGDASEVYGTVRGGADTMTIKMIGAAPAFAQGDAYQVIGSGVLVGGNDIIKVSGMGGVIDGDAYGVYAGAVLIGGSDTIRGGAGQDSISGDAGVVVGSAYGGNDTIYGGADDDQIFGDFSQIIGAAIAVGGNDRLFGEAGADTINGGGGNDLLDGGTEADTLDGAEGNDTYIVDQLGDKVFEAAGEGTDIVKASATYRLATGQSIEVLSTTSTSATTAINLTGNALSQSITGNAGANILDSGTGRETYFRALAATTPTWSAMQPTLSRKPPMAEPRTR
jgi:Ca2+-binding RTX toxin-like protein